jgi:hypothetical protein
VDTVVPVVQTVFADVLVEVLFFGLGCQRFWQAVEVGWGDNVGIVPISIDRQNHFITF